MNSCRELAAGCFGSGQLFAEPLRFGLGLVERIPEARRLTLELTEGGHQPGLLFERGKFGLEARKLLGAERALGVEVGQLPCERLYAFVAAGIDGDSELDILSIYERHGVITWSMRRARPPDVGGPLNLGPVLSDRPTVDVDGFAVGRLLDVGIEGHADEIGAVLDHRQIA